MELLFGEGGAEAEAIKAVANRAYVANEKVEPVSTTTGQQASSSSTEEKEKTEV